MVISGEKVFENTYEGVEHISIREILSSIPAKPIMKP
jgi:hypothetical protein